MQSRQTRGQPLVSRPTDISQVIVRVTDIQQHSYSVERALLHQVHHRWTVQNGHSLDNDADATPRKPKSAKSVEARHQREPTSMQRCSCTIVNLDMHERRQYMHGDIFVEHQELCIIFCVERKGRVVSSLCQSSWICGSATLGSQSRHYVGRALYRLLQKHFGISDQAERFWMEMHVLWHKLGEALQQLYNEMCCLMSLAYPWPSSTLMSVIGRDAFLEAVGNPSLSVCILDKSPTNTQEALHHALTLEVLVKSRHVELKAMAD